MSLPKYLVHSEQWFGGDKTKLFDRKEQAINHAKEWVKETCGKVEIIVSTFEPEDDGTYTCQHVEEPGDFGKKDTKDDWDLYSEELEESYNKLMMLDAELTKLNGGDRLPTPSRGTYTPSSYVLRDSTVLHTLPDVNGTYSVHLCGSSEAIERNIVEFRRVCGDGKNKTAQQVYEAYKSLLVR